MLAPQPPALPPLVEQEEQGLADILELLNPPLEKFAGRIRSFLSTLPPEVSTERILATYFDLFAHGFTLWDITYDYHKVHEYYYGAYLQAKQLVDENSSPQHGVLLEMLEKLTLAMIAFTRCENAMICNDPEGLLIAANDATNFMEDAQKKLLLCSALEPRLSVPIEKYCNLYLHNFRGLKICADIFLAALSREEKPIPISEHSSIKESLHILDIDSPEIASILRAHYIFAERFSQAQAQRSSDLVVKEGKLLLRAIGYMGEELVEALFEEYKDKSSNKKLDELCSDAKDGSGLPIKSVYSSYMQDIFDTILGDEYLQTIVFELPTNDSALRFSIRDGKDEKPYAVEKFQVCLTRFGSISVEFGISLKEDSSVSHVRVLESLISPHTGRFDFVWRDAPRSSVLPPDVLPSDELSIGLETMNFVEYLLKAQTWIERIRPVTQGQLCDTIEKMDNVLEKWRKVLCELANSLPRGFAEYPDEQAGPNEEREKALRKYLQEMSTLVQKWIKDPSTSRSSDLIQAGPNEKQVKGLRRNLQEYLQEMSTLVQKWIKDPSISRSSDLIEEGNLYFPSGVRFARLMDIAKEVLGGIECYLHSLLKKHSTSSRKIQTKPDDNFQSRLHFDPNIGWSAILSCNRLTVDDRDGRKREPITKEEYNQIFGHDQFKGFIIQSREARASLYDWLFVVTPSYRNLAMFRSHETDMMCITENRTFLYMADEPAYLVKQYIETARLLDDIRTLVFSFNNIAKKQIKQLEPFLKRNEESKLKESQQKLMNLRDRIERFHTHAEGILDLLRACTISKYQDHSDLLKAMIKERRMNDISDALERNMASLDRFHEYIIEQLQSRISKRAANNQSLLSLLVFILTIVSTVSAISGSYAFLQDALGSVMAKSTLLLLMMVSMVVVFLGTLIVSLISWLRSREI
jgi:hypothetical protein